MNKKLSKKVKWFEEEYGTKALLKVCLSSLNHLLVEKGLVTEKELSTSLECEMVEAVRRLG